MSVDNINYSEEKILVVDDEEDFGDMIQGLLKHKGFASHFVTNAHDALSELKKDKTYTFLITDIVMSGMNGLELTEAISKDFPDIAVIVMTGYVDGHRYLEVVSAGAIDFINKPFRIEELEAKIRRAIIEKNTRSELKRLTITDALTGLYNHRHFYSRLKDEITRSKRQNLNLAIILFDLDNFKQFNDKHGHIAGDELLQKFGTIIQSQIRHGVDSGFRYGGDEFAVILVDATPHICRDIGKRIEHAFEEECSEAASMGYAVYQNDMTAETLVAEADQHLYDQKNLRKKNSEE